MVRKLGQHSLLSEEDHEALLALPYQLQSLDSGKYIIREGDRATRCCVLLSGFAYRHKIANDGNRQIVSIHMAGDLIDLQNSILIIADHSVQALGNVEVAFINHRDILALAEARPAVARAFWKDTLVDGSIFREWIANVGRRDARTRTAYLLCEFALRQEAADLGERGSYWLPMTQEQLANALGLTPVHVNRTLQSIEAEGFISRDKRSVTIGDWEKLRALGDFNADYLHLEPMDETDVHPSRDMSR